ncbi:hypothetical protein V8D89_008383 [Ganoderma adspersum]
MPLPSCPPVSAYAVIQMDPTTMVTHLDAQALEEAQEIRPKKYLILTSFGLSFPFHGHPWSVYDVWPVGPSLRAVDEKRGLEPDMCIPIHPNETHPTGRAPAHPSSPFPYNNCYHWACTKLDLRVHVTEEGFDKTRAIRLPAGDMVDMTSLFSTDRGRGKRALLARKHAAPTSPSAPAPATSEPSKDATVGAEADVFEPPTKDFKDPEYIPLVHLWLDLPANLEQEDIGDPVDLYRERFAITSIIRRAHERNPELPSLREYIALRQDPYIGDSDSDSFVSGTASELTSEPDESEPEEDYIDKPKRFRPAKLLQKLRSSIRGMLCMPIQP